MAIVVEEERKYSKGLFSIITWVVVILVVVLGIYYVFFKRPDLVELALPSSLEDTQQILNIRLEPEDVINSPNFQQLKLYVTSPSYPPPGRENPFLAP